MFLGYCDESGDPELGKGTSHFVFAAVVVAGWRAREYSRQLESVMGAAGLGGVELHSGWLARRYLEQERIAGFNAMSHGDRRAAVLGERQRQLAAVSMKRDPRKQRDVLRSFKRTDPYIHLSFGERRALLVAVASLVRGWEDATFFAEATNKTAFVGEPRNPPFLEGFEQFVSRFESYLERHGSLGVIVQDQNDKIERMFTQEMQNYFDSGTQWRAISRIVETPLFVASHLTSLVQVADLAAYATRRYFENRETDLFDPFLSIADRLPNGDLCGVRHFTAKRMCDCKVCTDRRGLLAP